MKIEALHIGMKVRHPQHGAGLVKAIAEHTADVRFDAGLRTLDPEASGLEAGEAQVSITGLQTSLTALIQETAQAIVQAMGVEKPDAVVGELGARWHRGRMVLHPADPALQTKEIPLEVLFHKIVMIRNNLRVLEQKINGHQQLTDAEKVDIQQYITRSYGSLTTFNLLFKNKEEQFGGS
jgi:hypothetical protein